MTIGIYHIYVIQIGYTDLRIGEARVKTHDTQYISWWWQNMQRDSLCCISYNISGDVYYEMMFKQFTVKLGRLPIVCRSFFTNFFYKIYITFAVFPCPWKHGVTCAWFMLSHKLLMCFAVFADNFLYFKQSKSFPLSFENLLRRMNTYMPC